MQILDRCSLVSFAAYLPHKGEAYLFLEAPKGLPDKEKAGIQRGKGERERERKKWTNLVM